MTRARMELVSIDDTPYYHCVCRCVRRAFLCGEDHLTGKNYEHRKVWVVERLRDLADVFAIDICAYAVMSNHYHVVVRINPEKAQSLSERQVMLRWRKLFRWPLLISRYAKGQTASKAENRAAREIIDDWRRRLMDLSWFMRCLNEHLARKANDEDQCKGRFWEGRFKSQALLDEAAVLTCMSYVDLNPIRAKLAKTPETSDFTSIQQRIRELHSTADSSNNQATVKLMTLYRRRQDSHPNTILFSLHDYLELVDWAGRAMREDKRGSIPNQMPPILQRLNLNHDQFLKHLKGRGRREHQQALGSVQRLQQLAVEKGKRFLKGVGFSRKLYRETMPI